MRFIFRAREEVPRLSWGQGYDRVPSLAKREPRERRPWCRPATRGAPKLCVVAHEWGIVMCLLRDCRMVDRDEPAMEL